MLAAALEKAIGIRCTLVTDRLCESAVQAAALGLGNSPPACRGLPRRNWPWRTLISADRRFEEFVKTERGSQLTHMIAIERVGPSHDERSLSTQRRAGAAPLAEFLAKAPPSIATVATTPAEN